MYFRRKNNILYNENKKLFILLKGEYIMENEEDVEATVVEDANSKKGKKSIKEWFRNHPKFATAAKAAGLVLGGAILGAFAANANNGKDSNEPTLIDCDPDPNELQDLSEMEANIGNEETDNSTKTE